MITTFYSFKGGVGRSMALANIAELFYQKGLKVLIVDFDLEAPGLDRYFSPPNAKNALFTNEELLSKRGLIDMIMTYKNLLSLPAQKNRDGCGSDFLSIKFLLSFITPIFKSEEKGGSLSILTAGQRSGNSYINYAKLVSDINWNDFYNNCDGEHFFNWFIEQSESLFDVTLIDSRTGITDMGGVCTYHLADSIVIFVAPNQQNIDGVNSMAKSLSSDHLIEYARKGRPLSLLFVPSRVERSEADLLDAFALKFKEEFNKYIPNKLKFQNGFFADLKIPYVPYYSYMENVAAREPGRASALDIVQAFNKLAYSISQLAPDNSPLFQSYTQDKKLTESKSNFEKWIIRSPKQTIKRCIKNYFTRGICDYLPTVGDNEPAYIALFNQMSELNDTNTLDMLNMINLDLLKTTSFELKNSEDNGDERYKLFYNLVGIITYSQSQEAFYILYDTLYNLELDDIYVYGTNLHCHILRSMSRFPRTENNKKNLLNIITFSLNTNKCIPISYELAYELDHSNAIKLLGTYIETLTTIGGKNTDAIDDEILKPVINFLNQSWSTSIFEENMSFFIREVVARIRTLGLETKFSNIGINIEIPTIPDIGIFESCLYSDPKITINVCGREQIFNLHKYMDEICDLPDTNYYEELSKYENLILDKW
jgi:MinD-like ATPase involved in chromosome partitioning or flagellar assembly